MVRYPHTATISGYVRVRSGGETLSETPTTTTIKGRFEPSEGIRMVPGEHGEYKSIKGKFFTKTEAIAGAEKLEVCNVEFSIVEWHEYQSYCEIWLD